MDSVKEEKEYNYRFVKIPVIVTIILSFLSYGIFIPIWFLIQKKYINSLQSEKKSNFIIIKIILVIFIISFILLLISSINDLSLIYGFNNFLNMDRQLLNIIDGIDNFSSLICGILLVVHAFKVKNIISGHIKNNTKLRFNFSSIATFFLEIWYLQYKMNRLMKLSIAYYDTLC